ncbi:hypothetical protein BA6E_125334 [Bacteroidales bacterium 6E]|nr:hypothetical protein BA6E_125334 [Bacteroidales bacterium 6E]
MEHNPRPRPLEALCLMSFIGSGAAALLYLAGAVFFEKASEIIIEYTSAHSTEQISARYFLTLAVLYILSLQGVIGMWKLQRRGFFVYTAAQLAILAVPLLRMGEDAFSAVSVIFTVLFIVAYATQFRSLKKAS